VQQATLTNKPLELRYTSLQEQIFLRSIAKYVVGSCGRRSGKTFGAAQFLIDTMLNKDTHDTYLWVDVAYRNILGYVDKYFLPSLLQLKPKLWSWKVSNRQIDILGNTLLLRSADRPDLLVGAGYKLVVLNEAGIILQEGRKLWQQIIAPMMLDYPDSRAFLIGTPRGKIGRASCRERVSIDV
jgi:hypothetical protein